MDPTVSVHNAKADFYSPLFVQIRYANRFDDLINRPTSTLFGRLICGDYRARFVFRH